MADLKILYAPGKRPDSETCELAWFAELPDWRCEYPRCENPRCENPPREDTAIHFTRKSGGVEVSPVGKLNTNA